jgi:hypothetical protein
LTTWFAACAWLHAISRLCTGSRSSLLSALCFLLVALLRWLLLVLLSFGLL